MKSLEIVKEHSPKRPSSKYQPDSSTPFQASPRVLDKEEAGKADRCVGRLLGGRSRDLLAESYPTGTLVQVAESDRWYSRTQFFLLKGAQSQPGRICQA